MVEKYGEAGFEVVLEVGWGKRYRFIDVDEVSVGVILRFESGEIVYRFCVIFLEGVHELSSRVF